jgi:hypothetical protein
MSVQEGLDVDLEELQARIPWTRLRLENIFSRRMSHIHVAVSLEWLASMKVLLRSSGQVGSRKEHVEWMGLVAKL